MDCYMVNAYSRQEKRFRNYPIEAYNPEHAIKRFVRKYHVRPKAIWRLEASRKEEDNNELSV